MVRLCKIDVISIRQLKQGQAERDCCKVICGSTTTLQDYGIDYTNFIIIHTRSKALLTGGMKLEVVVYSICNTGKAKDTTKANLIYKQVDI